MSTAENLWVDEPGWLQKKRQLAAQLQERFPKYDGQDKWLPWQQAPTNQEEWLTAADSFQAMPLSMAVRHYSDLLQENMMEKALPWQDNQLFAAHLAAIDGGQFIYVPNNQVIKQPIRFTPRGVMTNPHNLILVGAHSRVTIIEEMRVKNAQPLFAGTEILMGSGAQVTYQQANDLRAPVIFTAVHAYQAHGSHLKTQWQVANAGSVTLSHYSFLDGKDTDWHGTVLLEPGKTGDHRLRPTVDGFGAGSQASLSFYVDESAGGQAAIDQFKTGSGEPLPIKSTTIEKTKAGIVVNGQPGGATDWHPFH